MFYLKSILFIFLLEFAKFVFGFLKNELNDYVDHPCIRDCKSSKSPMRCEYNWTIQMYTTMSKACFDCPFNITDCNRPHCISANGLKRQVTTVNKQIPGPAIQACQNDEIIVNLKNELRMGESTSIHWHGLLQKGTPFMDGVAMVTQCPILTHTSFQYKFIAKDVGTHLWHSHSGLQRADGLFGAVIIRSKQEHNESLFDFDLSEHIIVLNDWFQKPIALSFALHVHNDRSRFNWADSILINGKGVNRVNKFGLKNEKFLTPKAIFKVKNGFKYRFRLIHAGISHCAIRFSIQNHTVKTIATDGHLLEPVDVEAVILYPGERYDIVLNAKKKFQNTTHLIITKGLGNCENERAFETAYLVYDESNDLNKEIKYEDLEVSGKQLNNFETFLDKNQTKFIPLINLKTSNQNLNKTLQRIKRLDKKFYLGTSFERINNPEFNSEMLYPVEFVNLTSRYYMPQINHISMHMPSSPVLYQFDDIPKNSFCNENNINLTCPLYKTKLCNCIHMIELDLNDSVEFIMIHEKSLEEDKNIHTLHPFHLHGYSFALLGMGQFNQSEVNVKLVKHLDSAGKLKRNLENPIFKDTIVVPRNGYAILRFIADNPGVWMYHCHFDFHSETGMSLLVKVGKEQDLPPMPKNWPKCGSFSFDDQTKFFHNS